MTTACNTSRKLEDLGDRHIIGETGVSNDIHNNDIGGLQRYLSLLNFSTSLIEK